LRSPREEGAPTRVRARAALCRCGCARVRPLPPQRRCFRWARCGGRCSRHRAVSRRRVSALRVTSHIMDSPLARTAGGSSRHTAWPGYLELPSSGSASHCGPRRSRPQNTAPLKYRWLLHADRSLIDAAARCGTADALSIPPRRRHRPLRCLAGRSAWLHRPLHHPPRLVCMSRGSGTPAPLFFAVIDRCCRDGGIAKPCRACALDADV